MNMKLLSDISAFIKGFVWRVHGKHLKGTNAENCLSLQQTDIAKKLINEWNRDKNGELTPADIARGSGRKAWWKCEACGYEWEARVFSRYAGCGCPECAKVKAAWTRRNKKDKFQLQLFEANGSFPL